MSARPELRLIDASTGELVEHDEREILIDRLTRTLHGKEIQIGKMEKELRDLRAVEPEAQVIRDILGYWKERCSPNAVIAPAGKRWEKCRARLCEKLLDRDPWTSAELKLAIDGALLDPWMNGTAKGSKGYLDPQTIFRDAEMVQKLRDVALGFKAQTGVHLRDVLDVASDLRIVSWKHALRACECFMGGERYLTPTGPKSFEETEGTIQDVLTRDGWREAQIQAFGEREIQLVSFAPTSSRQPLKTTWQRHVACTPTHPWILTDGSVRPVAIGDSVPGVRIWIDRSGDAYEHGVRHGLVFGDGYLDRSRLGKDGLFRHVVELQGDRTEQYTRLFSNLRVFPSRVRAHPATYKGTGTVLAERSLKELPEHHDLPYLAGFVDGWLAADASMRLGTWKLTSINHEAVDWLSEIAPLIGYFPSGIGNESNLTTNKGNRTRCLRWLKLRPQPTNWSVRSIKSLGMAQTYCAVVPRPHEFVLEGGILTHNCGHRRIEHRLGDPDRGGCETCLLCGCVDFDEDPYAKANERSN